MYGLYYQCFLQEYLKKYCHNEDFMIFCTGRYTMSEVEYEYSFNVPSLQPYIQFCQDHQYHFVSKSKQTRIIYRKADHTMARITKNEIDGVVTMQLDFKEDHLDPNKIVIARKEAKALTYTDEEAVQSILQFLGYEKDNTLERTRYVYTRDHVKFEMDEYTYPEVTCVVGIEGDQKEVDTVYQEIQSLMHLVQKKDTVLER